MTRTDTGKSAATRAVAAMPPAVTSKQTSSGLLPQSAMTLRAAQARGTADFGWLKSQHSFSFGQYFDPEHVQFESLRVINDDAVIGGKGFPMHPHQNAEIFSYVLDGALAHKDTLGNGSTVKAGGVQYMSAGSGVRHSEFNPSNTETMRFLQIWLLPNVENQAPRYETMDISPTDKDGKLKLFLSKDGRDGSMKISADADIYAATLNGPQSISHDIPAGQKGWIQIARGSVHVNGLPLAKGDGLAIHEAGRLEITEGMDAEFILFNLEPLA